VVQFHRSGWYYRSKASIRCHKRPRYDHLQPLITAIEAVKASTAISAYVEVPLLLSCTCFVSTPRPGKGICIGFSPVGVGEYKLQMASNTYRNVKYVTILEIRDHQLLKKGLNMDVVSPRFSPYITSTHI
jgi:hypothetical protein